MYMYLMTLKVLDRHITPTYVASCETVSRTSLSLTACIFSLS